MRIRRLNLHGWFGVITAGVLVLAGLARRGAPPPAADPPMPITPVAVPLNRDAAPDGYVPVAIQEAGAPTRWVATRDVLSTALPAPLRKSTPPLIHSPSPVGPRPATRKDTDRGLAPPSDREGSAFDAMPQARWGWLADDILSAEADDARGTATAGFDMPLIEDDRDILTPLSAEPPSPFAMPAARAASSYGFDLPAAGNPAPSYGDNADAYGVPAPGF